MRQQLLLDSGSISELKQLNLKHVSSHSTNVTKFSYIQLRKIFLTVFDTKYYTDIISDIKNDNLNQMFEVIVCECNVEEREAE